MTGLALAVVALTNAWGSIAVDPVGATLVSYIPAGGREVLFRSAVKADADPRHICFNGGAPLCFPWVYDDEGRRAELHGCVYGVPWRWIGGKWTEKGGEELRFAVEADGYAVECAYRLGPRLEIEFSAKNLVHRDTPRRFTFAFHPYFAVSDVEKVRLTGVAPGPVAGHAHVKGVAASTCAAIEDPGWNRRIEVRSPQTNKMMYWNCGKEARAEYAPGEWRRFLCLEPTNNAAADAVEVQPGETATIRMSISVGDALSAEPPAAAARRREVAVSVIGLSRPSLPPVAESVPKVVKYWIDAMDREVGNAPDMIVLPECCDTVPTKDGAEKAAWIRLRGDAVLDAVRKYAAEHRCYIVYSAHREREDGRFANSSRLVDRKGNVVACYDKVFPTVGESGSRECPIVPGTEAVVAETDFGRVGFAICFDLNFDELRRMYAEKRPDIICFSSFFDGDFLQRLWARDCQAYMVSATCANWLEKQVVDPAGGVLLRGNYYQPTFTVRVNTNCRVLHLDENGAKFPAIARRYGRRVEIRNPGSVGTVTLLSNDPALPVDEVMREFSLESYTDYLNRSCGVRRDALTR